MGTKYQVMPDLTEEEYDARKQDIQERGVLVPVEYDEEGSILDGYHRVRACKELGIEDWPSVVRPGMTEEQKRIHARKLNLARRHLNQEQKRELIRGQLKEAPKSSDRQIAKMLGVDNSTVSAHRKKMVNEGELLESNTLIGADGKEYPRERETPLQSPPAKEQTEQIEGLSYMSSSPPEEDSLYSSVEPTPGTKAHVSYNSGNNEWYTPQGYIEIARRVMGSIDCDPATSLIANKTVKAATSYTVEDDGLTKEWQGNVWMNPPYAQPLIQKFADKFVEQWVAGSIKQGMVLVNNATETTWFQTLASKAAAIWFIKGRVKFLDVNGEAAGAPLQGQCILYFGDNVGAFISQCSGLVCRCYYG